MTSLRLLLERAERNDLFHARLFDYCTYLFVQNFLDNCAITMNVSEFSGSCHCCTFRAVISFRLSTRPRSRFRLLSFSSQASFLLLQNLSSTRILKYNLSFNNYCFERFTCITIEILFRASSGNCWNVKC